MALVVVVILQLVRRLHVCLYLGLRLVVVVLLLQRRRRRKKVVQLLLLLLMRVRVRVWRRR